MPVQVFTSSPITAAKADGVTPKTAGPEAANRNGGPPAATTSAATSSSSQPYPPAQPGARPSLPVETGAVQTSISQAQPTPTQTNQYMSPPPPQPGAVPTPSSARHVPPPPRAGESNQYQPQITAMPMPPQMSYAPPNESYAAQGGSSTSTTTASAPSYMTGPRPTPLQANDVSGGLSHPPGYQQNVQASEFNSYQREHHNASVAQESTFGGNQGDEKGVWGAAKKWAAAAGDSLAAAENEVWKRINKD